MYIYIYIYIYTIHTRPYIYTDVHIHVIRPDLQTWTSPLRPPAGPGPDSISKLLVISGGRLCTLIGVPYRLSMLSTFSTFANVLFQYKSPRAEGAKTDPPPGYTYEGTQTTA